jgi:hypothetical protein
MPPQRAPICCPAALAALPAHAYVDMVTNGKCNHCQWRVSDHPTIPQQAPQVPQAAAAAAAGAGGAGLGPPTSSSPRTATEAARTVLERPVKARRLREQLTSADDFLFTGCPRVAAKKKSQESTDGEPGPRAALATARVRLMESARILAAMITGDPPRRAAGGAAAAAGAAAAGADELEADDVHLGKVYAKHEYVLTAKEALEVLFVNTISALGMEARNIVEATIPAAATVRGEVHFRNRHGTWVEWRAEAHATERLTRRETGMSRTTRPPQMYTDVVKLPEWDPSRRDLDAGIAVMQRAFDEETYVDAAWRKSEEIDTATRKRLKEEHLDDVTEWKDKKKEEARTKEIDQLVAKRKTDAPPGKERKVPKGATDTDRKQKTGDGKRSTPDAKQVRADGALASSDTGPKSPGKPKQTYATGETREAALELEKTVKAADLPDWAKMKLGLCHKCNAKGHLARHCPVP